MLQYNHNIIDGVEVKVSFWEAYMDRQINTKIIFETILGRETIKPVAKQYVNAILAYVDHIETTCYWLCVCAGGATLFSYASTFFSSSALWYGGFE